MEKQKPDKIELITMIIIMGLVIMFIITGFIVRFSFEDVDLHAIKRDKLDVIANNHCYQYDMTPLNGAYLKDGYGWKKYPLCTKNKTDGSIDYYYLNEANVPMPYNR